MTNCVSATSLGSVIVDKSFPRITRTTLALYAGASGDHNPMHIDIDFAKKAGFPDVFAQGMLVMAMLGQALTDVVRPDRLRSFSTVNRLFVLDLARGDIDHAFGPLVQIARTFRHFRIRREFVSPDHFGERVRAIQIRKVPYRLPA